MYIYVYIIIYGKIEECLNCHDAASFCPFYRKPLCHIKTHCKRKYFLGQQMISLSYYNHNKFDLKALDAKKRAYLNRNIR